MWKIFSKLREEIFGACGYPKIYSGFHYGKSMKPLDLLLWSELAAEAISKEASKKNLVPLLVYRGMSGTAATTAIAMIFASNEFRFAQAYVRKEYETSHGADIELSKNIGTSHCHPNNYGLEQKDMFPVFVDDIISSGETFRFTKERLRGLKKPTLSYEDDEWIIVLQGGATDEYFGTKILCGGSY